MGSRIVYLVRKLQSTIHANVSTDFFARYMRIFARAPRRSGLSCQKIGIFASHVMPEITHEISTLTCKKIWSNVTSTRRQVESHACIGIKFRVLIYKHIVTHTLDSA